MQSVDTQSFMLHLLGKVQYLACQQIDAKRCSLSFLFSWLYAAPSPAPNAIIMPLCKFAQPLLLHVVKPINTQSL